MRGAYNKEAADELAIDFELLTGIDINSTSRETKIMYSRTLFYKILKDVNFMNDRMIADWFKSRGVKRNRASIFQALSKVNIYYKSFKLFRDYYDVYFKDKAKERLTLEKTQKKALKESKFNVHQNILKGKLDRLDVLINDLPIDKRSEIYELVNLRVKSWNWKTKDNYEIINCEGSLEGLCY